MLENVPVVLELVYDGSGSMSDGTQQPKWGALVYGSNEWTNALAAKPDTRAAVGSLAFGDTLDTTNSNGPYPTAADVAPAVVDGTQNGKLKGRLSGQPQGLTPTHAAMTAGYGVLDAVPAAIGRGKRALVYLSDGDLSESRPLSDYTTLAAGKLAGPGAVLTYAIGIGDVGSSLTVPANLAAIASAGGTARAGCDPTEKNNVSKMCHQQIDSKNKATSVAGAEVAAALARVRYHAVACEAEVTADMKATPARGAVSLLDASNKTQSVPASAVDGWSYDDPANPTKVILRGEACRTARSAAYRIQGALVCP